MCSVLECRTLPKGKGPNAWGDPSQFPHVCPATRAWVLNRVTQRTSETPLGFACTVLGVGTQRCPTIQNVKCMKASQGDAFMFEIKPF